jgi:outer membrane murein-binding lipoprotein Lpp
MADAIKSVKISTVQSDKPASEEMVNKKKTSSSVDSVDSYEETVASDYAKLIKNYKNASLENDQDLLAAMGKDAFGTIETADHSTPDVPDLYKDILADTPATELNMKPILARYNTLEKTLIAQILEDRNALKRNWELTTGQIQDLNRNIKQLERKLNDCREQITLTKKYYAWEQSNKAASLADD